MRTGLTSSKGYEMRSGLRIYPAHERAFDRIITELLHQLPARFILLTDVAGQIVASKGAYENVNIVALGSLVAGDLAASQEIARLTGEYQDYQVILREGQNSHILTSEVSDFLALLVQVSNNVTLGWARMWVQKACRELGQELADPRHQPAPENKFSMNDESEGNFSDLFSQALDDLWQE